MSGLIYEGRRYDPGYFMKAASCVNLVLAMIVLYTWQFTGVFVAEPVSVATETAISATGRPGMFETPYVYLWLSPLVASFFGWIAYKFEYKTFGRFVVLYPIALFVSSMVWFHYFHGI